MQDVILRNSSRLELSMRVIDLLLLEAAGVLASLAHFGVGIADTEPVHAILLHFCSGMAFLLFPQLDLYSSWRGRSMTEMLVRLAVAWGLVLLIGLVFSFLVHHVGSLSRMWLIDWYCIGLLLMIISRTIVHGALHYLRMKGMNIKRVVIVGYGRTGQEMHKRARFLEWAGYEVKAVHADPTDIDKIPLSIDRIESMENIPAYVEANGIHEVWITLPIVASAKMRELQYLLRNALIDIRWVPDILGLHMLSNKVGDFLGFPAVDLNQPISSGFNGVVKDCFDKAFSIVALVMLLPLFIVIAICIKFSSPGPVFFTQPRLGLNGRPFKCYKFRTMKLHKEEHGVVTQATKNDSRITPIGGFLRRTSLDELPQFFNVLRGEMSVVGPRPHALQHNEMYKELLEMYMLRHRVKPGITGWAQVNGHRGETDTVEKMAKRVQFDLHYIQNWSMWMDIRIIVWTAFKGWTGKNAY
jgi:putative colanic acid biosynthesis UDP-glucose lipid carrier transferase